MVSIKDFFMQEAYIVAGFRTAVTKSKKGGFRFMRSDELAIELIQGLMKSLPALEHKLIDDVIVGNAVPEAEQGLQFGRIIAAKALGIEVPGITINRYCASGLESIAMATAKIRTGMADCIIAGGTESMSMVPTAGWKTVPAYSIAKDEPDFYLSMGLTAEAVANEYSVTREDQDAFAVASYTKSRAAWESGAFDAEIVPVPVPQRNGEPILFAKDEEPFNVKFEKISGLRPAFIKDGTITAANASTMNDGAAAVVLMSQEKAEALGIKPIAILKSYADAEQAPEWFTTAPALAVPKAVDKAGITTADLDCIELNEAFSVVGLANTQIMQLDPAKVNIKGGAVSMGHPLGCSGARIVVTLIHALKDRAGKYGAAGICNGGGGATAVVIENC